MLANLLRYLCVDSAIYHGFFGLHWKAQTRRKPAHTGAGALYAGYFLAVRVNEKGKTEKPVKLFWELG